MKQCIKCKEFLSKTRINKYCTLCKNEMDLKSYHKNKEKRKQYIKQYKENNFEFVQNSREATKKWLKDRPNYMNNWYKNKKATNVNYKIIHNLRERIRISIKSNLKGAKTKELLGCSVDDLKQYLEKQFKEGMTWENYGLKGWHIDHIKPCSLFDLSDIEQQKQCFHYTNLQPLWWYDNLKKRAKY
jgi:hypothetical protein